MNVGVAGVVGNGLALNAAPGGRTDDFSRLRLDIAKADFFVLAVNSQVGVVEPGLLAQRLPRLDGDVAVCFGRQLQDDFASVDVRFNFWHAAGHALGGDQAAQLTQLLHLGLRVPGDALAAVAGLAHQRTQCGKALVHVGVVTFDHL